MSSSTPTRRRRRPRRVDARLGAADHPAPLAVGVAHAVHALEHRGLARDVVADQRLHARHVVRVHQAAPVGRDVRVVLVVAEHLAPARREVDRVVLDVEVPEAVVGATAATASLRSSSSRQVALRAQALEAGGEARADELQQQVQVRVPASARGCVEHSAMKPRTRPLSEKPQISTERMSSSANRAASDGVLAPRRQRVAEFERCAGGRGCSRDRAVRRARLALQYLRVERREQRRWRSRRARPCASRRRTARCRWRRPRSPRASASRLRLTQLSPPSLVSAWKSTATLVASTSRPTGGAIAVAEDDLGREEVGAVLLVAALGWGNGHRVRSDPLPVCLSLSVPRVSQRN